MIKLTTKPLYMCLFLLRNNNRSMCNQRRCTEKLTWAVNSFFSPACVRFPSYFYVRLSKRIFPFLDIRKWLLSWDWKGSFGHKLDIKLRGEVSNGTCLVIFLRHCHFCCFLDSKKKYINFLEVNFVLMKFLSSSSSSSL